MTSLLPEEESRNVTRLKKKSQSHPGVIGKSCTGLGLPGSNGGNNRDETRSFLEFSRENLSISNSELEQGFNRTSRSSRCCSFCSRQTLLSCAALLLALSCAGLEVWKLRRVLANAKDIEAVRKDVDGLKHRLLERDLLDELKAFEEELYGEGSDEDADTSTSTDYDSSYDDSSSSPSFGSTTASSVTSSGTTSPCTTSKDLEDVLALLRRAEAERGRELMREREQLLEEERERRRRTQSEKGKRKRKRRHS